MLPITLSGTVRCPISVFLGARVLDGDTFRCRSCTPSGQGGSRVEAERSGSGRAILVSGTATPALGPLHVIPLRNGGFRSLGERVPEEARGLSPAVPWSSVPLSGVMATSSRTFSLLQRQPESQGSDPTAAVARTARILPRLHRKTAAGGPDGRSADPLATADPNGRLFPRDSGPVPAVPGKQRGCGGPSRRKPV